MEWMLDPQSWAALVTLTFLEIILGIDNIVFISIVVAKLPHHQQARARSFGLMGAMGTRILLLLSLTWMMNLSDPLFTIANREISWRDVILIVGGLFLLWKATMEIHEKIENAESHSHIKGKHSFWSVIFQIALLDIIFSIDSVITAVGMAQQVIIMVLAIVIAISVMIFSSKYIFEFINRNPTIKILALSFLILIGVALIGEGLDLHIPKGYIYFAMAFSIFVEMLNKKVLKAIVHRDQKV